MPMLKCKICGGDIDVSADKTFGTCEYCGSGITLPKVSDEKRAELFNRGNRFRMAGEFDKALEIYEKIIDEDPKDAEAHWCAAISRFGIEWVEDPVSLEYLPTCHRASFDIFSNDPDYILAIDYSEGLTQRQYKKDAAKIVDVQKRILSISKTEKPYDVFICYKESGPNGERTVDSTLAQEIYYRLTDEGVRVFFARISLEEKAGSEYEPIIFAALNSAKAMVVVGTKPEHFNSVWVRNEWLRYLSIIRKDHSRTILPCYRDMDPYELPRELGVLQSFDMSRIGFIQDLISGIKKIIQIKKDEGTPVDKDDNKIIKDDVSQLIKRAFVFIEDSEWEKADNYLERILDVDASCVQAYLGKLMVEKHVNELNRFQELTEPIENSKFYQRILKLNNAQLSDFLRNCNSRSTINRKKAEQKSSYLAALNRASKASSFAEFEELSKFFGSLGDYEECSKLSKLYHETAQSILNHIQEHHTNISFGRITPDAAADYSEPLLWTCLKKDGNKAFLVSKNIIGFYPFSLEEGGLCKWDDSSIRKWLNADFYNDSFSEEEQNYIIGTQVETVYQPRLFKLFYPKRIINTQDNIFILSQEDTKYMSVDEMQSRLLPCIEKNTDTNIYKPGFYWLRTLGIGTDTAMYVDEKGKVVTSGGYGGYRGIGVRPAMWIKIR